jgi:tryptophan synthase alpha chain
MSEISSIFRQPGHKALIAYVTIGYPSIKATLEVVPVLAASGCDMVELGIPFSDPLADGATIQQASIQALQNGVNPRTCLDTATKLRKAVAVPLAFMTYFNPVYHYGLKQFCHDCASAGVSGLLIPDLLPEEGIEMEAVSQTEGLDLIYFLSPASTEERIGLVAERSHGFIYLVSVTGVTGARQRLPENLSTFVDRVRAITAQPLCVGFGIATPEQAAQVARIADGVIVGSKIIQLLDDKEDYLDKVGKFIKRMRQSLD